MPCVPCRRRHFRHLLLHHDAIATATATGGLRGDGANRRAEGVGERERGEAQKPGLRQHGTRRRHEGSYDLANLVSCLDARLACVLSLPQAPASLIKTILPLSTYSRVPWCSKGLVSRASHCDVQSYMILPGVLGV